MAALLVSFIFTPFFYGLEVFLASTLTTQIALSVATIVVSTATVFYCQRALYQWYEDTTEFIVNIRNKAGLGERHAKFTAKGSTHDEDGEESSSRPSSKLVICYTGDEKGENRETEHGDESETSSSSTASESSASKDKGKSEKPLDSWIQKETVAMHRSHWVVKPGKIAPSTFIGTLGLCRRASADSSPPHSQHGQKPVVTVSSGNLSEQKVKPTLDRRQSSPSTLCSSNTKISTGRTESIKQELEHDLLEIITKATEDTLDLIDSSQHQTEPEDISVPSLELLEEQEKRSISTASDDVSEDGIFPRDYESVDTSEEDIALALDETPLARLIPTETEVREAVLVESSSPGSTSPLQGNMHSVPININDSDRQSQTSQTSEDRFSGQTDTDSLVTDEIFSDSELDDSKRSDDVFIHDDTEILPDKVPLIAFDRSNNETATDIAHSVENIRPDIVVCEAVETASADNTDVDPDSSSVSLSVDKGPVPRKDSFGLAPVLKCRVHHVKIETTSYPGPVTTISVEESKSESDNEVAGILSKRDTDGEESGNTTKININRPPPPSPHTPQRQDSLGVPPVVTGEISFPGAMSRPVSLGTSNTQTNNSSSREIPPIQTVESLEIPPIIRVEDHPPPLPMNVSDSKKETELVQEICVTLPSRKLQTRHGRPSSLDIPSLNISESCPPRVSSTQTALEFTKSSLSRLYSAPCSSRRGKQGPSILKRSGSVDRSGPKKSVSFSPIVIPWGGMYGEGIEPLGKDSDLKRRHTQSEPVRPKIFRCNSVDVPDTMQRRQRTAFIREMGILDDNSDEDQDWEQSRFARFYRKPNQKSDRKEGKGDNTGRKLTVPKEKMLAQISSVVSGLSSADYRKGAKERFLEAGSARAVMSVLCTQDSSDKSSTMQSPTSIVLDTERTDTSPGRKQKGNVKFNLEDATNGAKSRFLRSDDGNRKASRLFFERVRGSMELSEPQSDNSSPSDTTDDTSSSSDQQFEENEEGGIRSTTAKSRFLLSCREHVGIPSVMKGSISLDRLIGIWEPVAPVLLEMPGNEGEKKGTHSLIDQTEPVKTTCLQFPAIEQDDTMKDATKYDIDSPESSGVHSMETDELMSDRILSLREDSDNQSQTKHVPFPTVRGATGGYHPDLKTAIVMDNGSQYTKIGLIDEEKPSIEIHSAISRDRGESSKGRFIGLEAVKNCNLSPFEFPIQGGHVDNWSDVESIWQYMFDAKLGLIPQEHPLLMTEIATVPKSQREKSMEILFETFHIPSLYFANQAALSLRASGMSTGLVLSSGSGITEVVPVYNGVTMNRAVTKLDLGGRSVTKQLAHLVEKDTGRRLTSSAGVMEVFRELKEDQTFVNKITDGGARSDSTDENPWECWLPDGSTVTVNRQHVQECAEPLFQPSLAGILHQPSMPNLVADCLDRCDQDLLSEFPSSLLLCGGNTYLGGFTDRLQFELNTLGLGYISVDASKARDLLPWMGGSLLASQLNRENRWITRADYLEYGPSIVHKTCT